MGTVDFTLYPNTTCTGTGTTQAGVLLASAVAESATTTVPNTGLSYRVNYNGQSGVYSVNTGPCVSVTATATSTTLNTALSSTTIMAGVSVSQSATLSGATANATGTVAYNVYTNNACNLGEISGGIKTVTNATVPNSNLVQFNTVGTLYWQAKYSGDMNNAASNGPCQSLAVLATTTPTTPPPTPVPPTATTTASISGTVFNDVIKNHVKDATDPGIAGVTVKLYQGKLYGKKLYSTVVTDSNGFYSFSNIPVGKYSIEEIIPSGWKQITGDFKNVKITSTTTSITGKNFANATSTPKKDKKDKDEKREEKFQKQYEKHINKLHKLFDKFGKPFQVSIN